MGSADPVQRAVVGGGREGEGERERERVAQAEECILEASWVGKPIVESMMQKCSSMAVQEIMDATVEDTAVGRQLAERGRRREEQVGRIIL